MRELQTAACSAFLVFCRFADGEITDELVFLRNAQNVRHFAPETVFARYFSLYPAAFISERDDREQHILDRSARNPVWNRCGRRLREFAA